MNNSALRICEAGKEPQRRGARIVQRLPRIENGKSKMDKGRKTLRIKAIAAWLLSLVVLTACGGIHSTVVIIAGSTSVQPYVEVLAEEYTHRYPEEHIDVQGGGTSAGIQAVESGTAVIGMCSRHLMENEMHLWSIEIAKDGLAIIVHPDNPVNSLTLDQIRGIYSGQITNWSELGGSDSKIHVITREEGSGTRSAYEELVMDSHRIDPRSIVQDSNGAVRQIVSGDRFSIGFISLGLVDIGEKPVKALQIGDVAPTRDNVVNGRYALFRSFLFVAKEEPTGVAMRFIEFVRSPEGQRLLAAEGLIPE